MKPTPIHHAVFPSPIHHPVSQTLRLPASSATFFGFSRTSNPSKLLVVITEQDKSVERNFRTLARISHHRVSNANQPFLARMPSLKWNVRPRCQTTIRNATLDPTVRPHIRQNCQTSRNVGKNCQTTPSPIPLPRGRRSVGQHR